ncbi:sigma-70 family RNA polymerase sigma factor [Nakamurella aerolata]
MTSNAWTEAERLMPAVLSGDRAALDRVIALTQHDVRRFLAVHADPSEAEDLTQETFLRALPALQRFQGRSSLRTYLLVIARRVAVDHVRRRAVRPRTAGTDDWLAAADRADHRAGRTAGSDRTGAVEIRELLEKLPRERREALILTQVIGMDYAEAAAICDCPIGTIRSRVARGRDELITMMRGDVDAAPAAETDAGPHRLRRRSGG